MKTRIANTTIGFQFVLRGGVSQTVGCVPMVRRAEIEFWETRITLYD
jgi:hypothetical protein